MADDHDYLNKPLTGISNRFDPSVAARVFLPTERDEQDDFQRIAKQKIEDIAPLARRSLRGFVKKKRKDTDKDDPRSLLRPLSAEEFMAEKLFDPAATVLRARNLSKSVTQSRLLRLTRKVTNAKTRIENLAEREERQLVKSARAQRRLDAAEARAALPLKIQSAKSRLKLLKKGTDHNAYEAQRQLVAKLILDLKSAKRIAGHRSERHLRRKAKRENRKLRSIQTKARRADKRHDRRIDRVQIATEQLNTVDVAASVLIEAAVQIGKNQARRETRRDLGLTGRRSRAFKPEKTVDPDLGVLVETYADGRSVVPDAQSVSQRRALRKEMATRERALDQERISAVSRLSDEAISGSVLDRVEHPAVMNKILELAGKNRQAAVELRARMGSTADMGKAEARQLATTTSSLAKQMGKRSAVLDQLSGTIGESILRLPVDDSRRAALAPKIAKIGLARTDGERSVAIQNVGKAHISSIIAHDLASLRDQHAPQAQMQPLQNALMGMHIKPETVVHTPSVGRGI